MWHVQYLILWDSLNNNYKKFGLKMSEFNLKSFQTLCIINLLFY